MNDHLNYKIKKTWANNSANEAINLLSDQDDDSNSGNLQIDTDRESDQDDSPKIEIIEQVIIKEKHVKKNYKKFTAPPHIQIRTKKSGENVFYCKICDREFKTKQQRYYHQYCQSEKPFKCSYMDCKKSFTTESLRKDHEDSHSIKNLFQCDKCEKSFKRKSSLRKHNYFHEGKYKYECGDCGKLFLDKVKFEVHQNIHKKLLPYQCSQCDKSFAAKNYLQKHQILHSDETKYQCSKCDQKFKWLTSLTLHKTTMHNENKEFFKCASCHKDFLTKRALERHEKIHSNVRYKCTLCENVQSNRKDNLMRHVRHLHSEIESSKVSEYIESIREENEAENESEDDVEVAETTIEEDVPEKLDSVLTENLIDTTTTVSENCNLNDAPSTETSTGYNPVRYTFVTDYNVPSQNFPTSTSISVESPIPETPKNSIETSIEVPQSMNVRSSVICSVGRPSNLIEGAVRNVDPPKVISEEPAPSNNDDVIIIDPPEPSEIHLPPKKKATLGQKTAKSNPPAKPKYDPIKHYRKMLLLQDDEPQEEIVNVDDNENEDTQEDTTSKLSNQIHWRKRTSQNWWLKDFIH